MNRIGGPSALPHSRTCSRRPPPPRTAWTFIRPVCSVVACNRCHLSPPRVRRVDAIVAVEERERIGRRALSFAAGLRIFGRGVLTSAFPPGSAARYWPEWRLARARCSSDAHASSGSSSARSTRRGRGAVRPSSSPERRASARPGSRPSSRGAPATPGSRSSLGRSIDLVGTELPYQPFVEALRPLGEPRQADGGRPARSCGCSRRRSRCSPSAPLPRLCCSCSRICTGPTPRRSISSSSSRTTSTTGRFCCSRPTARTSPRRPSACAGWPTASGARARRSCSSSVRSATTS